MRRVIFKLLAEHGGVWYYNKKFQKIVEIAHLIETAYADGPRYYVSWFTRWVLLGVVDQGVSIIWGNSYLVA